MAAPPKGATPAGSEFYLFKSSTNTTDCLVSAHGGYLRENRMFKVPKGVTVMFYGRHGADLNDPGILKLAAKISRAKPVDVVTEGENCWNYLLTKYQGAHAGDSGRETIETYEDVAASVEARDRQRATLWKHSVAADKDQQELVYAALVADWGGSVLTVRNRWNVLMGMPLASAIDAARKVMPTLATFHCSFCRSYQFGESESVSVEYDQSPRGARLISRP